MANCFCVWIQAPSSCFWLAVVATTCQPLCNGGCAQKDKEGGQFNVFGRGGIFRLSKEGMRPLGPPSESRRLTVSWAWWILSGRWSKSLSTSKENGMESGSLVRERRRVQSCTWSEICLSWQFALIPTLQTRWWRGRFQKHRFVLPIRRLATDCKNYFMAFLSGCACGQLLLRFDSSARLLLLTCSGRDHVQPLCNNGCAQKEKEGRTIQCLWSRGYHSLIETRHRDSSQMVEVRICAYLNNILTVYFNPKWFEII